MVKKTKDGFEQQIGVNHLGPFLLTRLLIPLLQKGVPFSRIVCISTSHGTLAPPNFLEDLMLDKNVRTGDNGREQYNISKLCNFICMLKLADGGLLGDHVKLFQVCPGFIKSDLHRADVGLIKKIQQCVAKIAIGQSIHQGSETAVYCTVGKSLVEIDSSGKGEMYRFMKRWELGNGVLKEHLEMPRLETTDKLYMLSEELVELKE